MQRDLIIMDKSDNFDERVNDTASTVCDVFMILANATRQRVQDCGLTQNYISICIIVSI